MTNKTANKKGQASEDDENELVEEGLEPRQVIKIQNSSLDSYLESLLDEKDNAGARLKREFNDGEINAETELNLSYKGPDQQQQLSTPKNNAEFGVQVELVKSPPQLSTPPATKQISVRFNKDSPTTKATADTSTNANNQQLSLVSHSYNSHFIDLLSLNLDRSKTWVEMTEAKLNYMIGETDAVLRSMCFDSSEDEEPNPTTTATIKQTKLRNDRTLSIETSSPVPNNSKSPRANSRSRSLAMATTNSITNTNNNISQLVIIFNKFNNLNI